MTDDINSLQQKIRKYNQQYRDGELSITDTEFDLLVDTLENAMINKLTGKGQNDFNIFKESLHEVEGTVKHPYVMGSLDKIKSDDPEKLLKFIQKYCPGDITKLFIAAKIDGCACRVQYRNGVARGAYTRGDGYYGQDLSNKIPYLKNVPLQLDVEENVYAGMFRDKTIDIRGELVITTEDFDSITTREYKNPRNATAGIINRKEANRGALTEKVSFIAYEIMGPQGWSMDNTAFTREEQFKILKALGFTTAYHYQNACRIGGADKEELIGSVESLGRSMARFMKQDFGYGTDGFVISSPDYKNDIENYFPEGMAAFKDDDLVAVTKISDIEWAGPSKDGRFVPIALIEPVDIGGSTISRVALHNIYHIKRMSIKIGSTVTVVKSGDIIPKILNVID